MATLTASTHLKLRGYCDCELPLSLSSGSKHLPSMMWSDLHLHLVFHPLISCNDVVLVSERRMGFIESEPFRARRRERSPHLTLHLVDKTLGPNGEDEVSRSHSWPVAKPGPKLWFLELFPEPQKRWLKRWPTWGTGCCWFWVQRNGNFPCDCRFAHSVMLLAF